MTINLPKQTSGAFLAALLLGVSLLAVPMQASAQTAAPPAATAAKQKAPSRVEAHIATLKKQLKITAAEEPQWDAVAQAMRDNAAKMSGLIADRNAKATTLNAVDDLKSYQAIAEAHATNVQALIAPFQTLYDAMPDAQKKVADSVFIARTQRAAAKKTTKKSS